MSILIKGMKLPKNCLQCPFRKFWDDEDQCLAKKNLWVKGNEIPPVCPLIELPPHGKLIDADALMLIIQEYLEEYTDLDEDGMHNLKWCAMKETEMAINDAPTIIEADNTQNMRDESEGEDG